MLGERMEREIREQPEVLARGAKGFWPPLLRAVSDRKLDMVLLAARGSSDNAALYARYLIEVHLEIPVSLAAPSVLTRYGRHVRYKRCLGIGISQSGAAPDVAEVLSALRVDRHLTLAITNTAGSRLTKEAEFSLLLEAGEETSVAATKTYSSSLLALYQTARAMDARLPDPRSLLPDDGWVEAVSQAAREASSRMLQGGGPFFALGRGYGFATAQEAALKLMECALLPCKSYSSADFEHGPKALAGPGSIVISFDGPKPELAAQGSCILEAPSAPVPEELRPLWDVVFAQWLALHAARERGLDPDNPQHIRKVTETL